MSTTSYFKVRQNLRRWLCIFLWFPLRKTVHFYRLLSNLHSFHLFLSFDLAIGQVHQLSFSSTISCRTFSCYISGYLFWVEVSYSKCGWEFEVAYNIVFYGDLKPEIALYPNLNSIFSLNLSTFGVGVPPLHFVGSDIVLVPLNRIDQTIFI